MKETREITINLNIHDSSVPNEKGSRSLLLTQHVGTAKDEEHNIEYELSTNPVGTAMMINVKGSPVTFYITYDDLFVALENANLIVK
jgi:hypothetical protein